MFDYIELTKEQEYLLCNNIITTDLLSITNTTDYSLHEHPYALLYERYNLPLLTTNMNLSTNILYKKPYWNILKNYIPKNYKEIFSFEWKKEWERFYKKCQLSNISQLKIQNVFPHLIFEENICRIKYISITNSIDLTECIKELYSKETLYNKYSKILFSTMIFDLNKISDISFISYLLKYFRILTIKYCICSINNNKLNIDYSLLDLYSQYQLKHTLETLFGKELILSNKDIDNLKLLGLKLRSDEPEMIIEANMINNTTNLFDSLWEFKWKVVIGNNTFTESQFKKLVEENAGIIKGVNVNDIIKKFKTKPKKINHGELFRCYLLEKISINNGKEFLSNLNRTVEFELPITIKTQLRNYQITGYNWILSNLINGFGVLLADEMGLGKTLQTLVALGYLIKNNTKVLILCPTILQINWLREIKLHTTLSAELLNNTNNADIIITSYETFASRHDKLNFKFDCIVLDEAQKVKNPSTKIWKCLQDIIIKYRIIISGTPIENNLTDLWALMQIVFPGYLGSKSYFLKEFSQNKEKLFKLIEPFLLRRKKSECALELPPKVESICTLDLTLKQTALYQKCLEVDLNNMDSLSKFKLVTHLKMICNHPSSFSNEIESNFELSNKCIFVKDFLNENDNVVIFTQFIEMGKILQNMLKKELNLNIPFLQGEDSLNERQNKIDQFQNGKVKAIIISLRTGGNGITLTRANYVIMYDLWWNPSVINQAIDRTHRIGQLNTVYVYLLITKGTIEEKIYNMILKKQELSDNFLQSNEKWITKMNNDELKELFKLC